MQLEAKQKARKKEERQNLMGEYRPLEMQGRRCPTCRQETEAQRRVEAGVGAAEPCLVGQPHPEQSGAGDVAQEASLELCR